MINKVLKYLNKNKTNFSLIKSDDYIIGVGIENKSYYICNPIEGKILDKNEFTLLDFNLNFDFQIYEFGGKLFYSKSEHPDFKLFEYVGESTEQNEELKSFLGVHGKMEILRGSRDYSSWAAKAKFLGIENLGICEYNSLAGAVKFQLACKKFDINSIIGMSVLVKDGKENLQVKLYVQNQTGWDNILRVNKAINIDNEGFIELKQLLSFKDGLTIVIDPKYTKFENKYIDFSDWFYSVDMGEFVSDKADDNYYQNLGKFISSKINPIAITDAYYLEENHAFVSEFLEIISKESNGDNKLVNQYFPTEFEYQDHTVSLFEFANEGLDFWTLAVNNLNEIVNSHKFKIPEMSPETRHLPEYKMREDEREVFGNQENFLIAIIEEGFIDKVPKGKEDIYRTRIEHELEVIKYGNVANYFLILWDIIMFAKGQNILVGIGRGSAAGSLVAYLMGITGVDPLEYNLLFERFLNPGRVESSLPDIDVDFSSHRRNEVKEYVISRYGADMFCDVGTYTNLKPKSLIKEFGSMNGMEHWKLNDMTRYWADVPDMEALFKIAHSDNRAKKFIEDNSEMINDMDLILGQPKAESIHACATIIVPEGKTIHEQIPVKWMSKDGEKVLVSQWEGSELEAIGYLKEDLLGVAILDKYEMMLDLINKNNSDEVKLDLASIPLGDKDVLDYFGRGENADIFHFGSVGLSQYCQEMKPQNMDELIAGIALYRPGPMSAGFHKKYLKLKTGKQEPEYLPGCEKITKDTFGLLIYQEQIMLVCQYVGGLTLAEADSIRKSMVKKDLNSITKFADRFLENAVKVHNIAKEDAENLWNLLVDFSSYGFNKSHATAYTITAYYGQWFKHYYPLEFWTTAFTFAKKDDYSIFLSEIHKSENIQMRPPDINLSGEKVVSSESGMVWSLKSIKGVGGKAYDQILKIRNKNGAFVSFEHFLKLNSWKANKKAGIEGSKVNKTVIEALIRSGAFDNIEGIDEPKERTRLIEEYRVAKKVKVDKEKDWFTIGDTDKNYFWSLWQKLLSGVAFFNYEEIAFQEFDYPYINTPGELLEMEDENVVVVGIVDSIIVRTTRKKEKMVSMVLEHNFEFIHVTIWADQYSEAKHLIDNSVGKILIISGICRYDNYKKTNVVYSKYGGFIDCI